MIKKNKPYQPFPEENILTKAPKNLEVAYEQSLKTSDPEVVVQADPNAKPMFLNTETGAYTDENGNPVTVKPRLGCNSKVWLINSDDVDRFDGSKVVLKNGKKAQVFEAAPSDGKTLEDLLTPEAEKQPSLSAILSLIAVFALGLVAAGAILLALYNCVAHP